MRPVERILSVLDKVRNRGDSSWMACCPAHTDKNPSLSIKETQDGDILLHCFAGCGVDDVLAALGLEMSDLFSKQAIMVSSTHNTFTAEDVLVALVDELEGVCLELSKDAIDATVVAEAHLRFMDSIDFIKGLK